MNYTVPFTLLFDILFCDYHLHSDPTKVTYSTFCSIIWIITKKRIIQNIDIGGDVDHCTIK